MKKVLGFALTHEQIFLLASTVAGTVCNNPFDAVHVLRRIVRDTPREQSFIAGVGMIRMGRASHIATLNRTVEEEHQKFWLLIINIVEGHVPETEESYSDIQADAQGKKVGKAATWIAEYLQLELSSVMHLWTTVPFTSVDIQI